MFAALLPGRASAEAAPWLFVSDIHLEASKAISAPSRYGQDTNAFLFDSLIRDMRAVDPNAPVVVITGDLLAHLIKPADAPGTAVRMARAFNAAFPHAQFVLVLGNEDSSCGDYALSPNEPFLRTVARAWAPLVNRNGAAPNFVRTFSHDGFYTATLPVKGGLHAVIVDDVFWSARYAPHCLPAGNIRLSSLHELDRALQSTPGNLWVLFHIPPGIDAFSTAHIAHRLALVPFLAPDLRDQFLIALHGASARISLAVAGHTHKFAYRVLGATDPHPIPLLMVPAVSPIFANAPMYLTATVRKGGSLGTVRLHAFDKGRWSDIGGMPSLGVTEFTPAQLLALQERLLHDGALRDTYARLYSGGARPEIGTGNWPIYWCATTALGSTSFRQCTHTGGFSFVTRRGFDAIGLTLFVLVFAIAGLLVWRVRRRALRS